MSTDRPTFNINQVYAYLIVEELVRCGVELFCIAPGSRSTPLTLAAAMNPKARTVVHYDERGLAYFALGYARGAGKPAAVITTSGTAAANLHPALIEASKSNVPLILLTADRPPEARDSGANQTIDQVKLFGNAVRWWHEFACPHLGLEIPAQAILSAVDYALQRAREQGGGPVHLNCPYREPLGSAAPEPGIVRLLNLFPGASEWHTSQQPNSRSLPGKIQPSEEAQRELIDIVAAARQPLLVVGQLNRVEDARMVERFLESARWPVFADICSGIRLGTHGGYSDLLLGTNPFNSFIATDLIVYAGGAVTSKTTLQFLENARPKHFVRALDHPFRHDATFRSTLRVETAFAPFFQWMEEVTPKVDNSDWQNGCEKFFRLSADAVRAFFDQNDLLSEPMVARCVARMAPEDSIIFAGNSMPIRDLDLVSAPGRSPVRVTANRGASGIDGTVATAAGLAESGLVTALLGDLAVLHDLPSLALLRNRRAILVVINNDGGGIFHFLPIAQNEAVFEKYFGTPHGLDFQHAASQFGLGYTSPTTVSAFEAAYAMSLESGQSCIIEVKTDRVKNRALHQQLRDAVAQALAAD
ncbi:MAG: 2-succinyl-5-enolpyruvyl-6-hydroxy-3-cyclohexene-1-carboxylate synthase [Candidatus Hydrogenedentota bacterium]